MLAMQQRERMTSGSTQEICGWTPSLKPLMFAGPELWPQSPGASPVHRAWRAGRRGSCRPSTPRCGTERVHPGQEPLEVGGRTWKSSWQRRHAVGLEGGENRQRWGGGRGLSGTRPQLIGASLSCTPKAPRPGPQGLSPPSQHTALSPGLQQGKGPPAGTWNQELCLAHPWSSPVFAIPSEWLLSLLPCCRWGGRG